MTAAVDVVDHTGLVSDHEAVRGLVAAVLDAEGRSGEVAVAFVDEPAMTTLNARYRDAEGSTDVLAFDYSEEAAWPGNGSEAAAGVTGEIVACPRVIARYAAEEGRDAGVQLGWTLIHGALHLAGYDHETDSGEMRAREQELLAELEPRVRALSLAKNDL